MKLTTIGTVGLIALAALALTGTAAALPADVAAQGADDAEATAPEDPREHAGDDQRDAGPEAAGENAPVDVGDRGPPAGLPDQVPAFVGDVHDAIGSFLGGDGEGALGDRISSLTPDDGDDRDAAEKSPVDANESAV